MYHLANYMFQSYFGPSDIFSIQHVPTRHLAWAPQWSTWKRWILWFTVFVRKQLLFIELNTISFTAIIFKEKFGLSERFPMFDVYLEMTLSHRLFWCQLALPVMFGYYLFMEHGAKLESLSKVALFKNWIGCH